MSHDFEPTDAEKEMMTLVQSSPAPHSNYERVTANKDDLQVIVELLADVEHERWASWQSYLHSKLYEIDDNRVSLNHHLKILPTELYDRWERQIATPYSQLSESEKQSDREEVKKTLRALVQMGYRISKSDQQLQKARKEEREIVKHEVIKLLAGNTPIYEKRKASSYNEGITSGWYGAREFIRLELNTKRDHSELDQEANLPKEKRDFIKDHSELDQEANLPKEKRDFIKTASELDQDKV